MPLVFLLLPLLLLLLLLLLLILFLRLTASSVSLPRTVSSLSGEETSRTSFAISLPRRSTSPSRTRISAGSFLASIKRRSSGAILPVTSPLEVPLAPPRSSSCTHSTLPELAWPQTWARAMRENSRACSTASRPSPPLTVLAVSTRVSWCPSTALLSTEPPFLAVTTP